MVQDRTGIGIVSSTTKIQIIIYVVNVKLINLRTAVIYELFS
jgi:hypothetical protein